MSAAQQTPLVQEWSHFAHVNHPAWDTQWWFCMGAQAALFALKVDTISGKDRPATEVMNLLDTMMQEALDLQSEQRANGGRH